MAHMNTTFPLRENFLSWTFCRKDIFGKKTDAFIFKLAANLLMEFVRSHVYSQHEVVNDCNGTVLFKQSTVII